MGPAPKLATCADVEAAAYDPAVVKAGIMVCKGVDGFVCVRVMIMYACMHTCIYVCVYFFTHALVSPYQPPHNPSPPFLTPQVYSYDVQWAASDVRWASRWDIYLNMDHTKTDKARGCCMNERICVYI